MAVAECRIFPHQGTTPRQNANAINACPNGHAAAAVMRSSQPLAAPQAARVRQSSSRLEHRAR
eukprot:2896092-Alexandrium_andersonii.AAC.1